MSETKMNDLKVGYYYKTLDEATIKIIDINPGFRANYVVISQGRSDEKMNYFGSFNLTSSFGVELKLVKYYKSPLWKAVNE